MISAETSNITISHFAFIQLKIGNDTKKYCQPGHGITVSYNNQIQKHQWKSIDEQHWEKRSTQSSSKL